MCRCATLIRLFSSHSSFCVLYTSIVAQLEHNITNIANENLKQVSLSITSQVTNRCIWRLQQQIRINPKLPWIRPCETSNNSTTKTLYAAEDFRVYGPRFDDVEYLHQKNLYQVFIQLMLTGKIQEVQDDVAIIRYLKIAYCHPHKQAVIHVFGRTKLALEIQRGSNGDVLLDCVL